MVRGCVEVWVWGTELRSVYGRVSLGTFWTPFNIVRMIAWGFRSCDAVPEL